MAFRQNRAKPARKKDWTEEARQAEGREVDAEQSENIAAKGSLSRQRTVTVPDDPNMLPPGLRRGTVVAMRGLYADVDDGERVWPCTIRRVLRTRLIEERHPVTVGDRIGFQVESSGDAEAREGVIEFVEARCGELRRRTGQRVHTIVANVDYAIIVSSAAQPKPKPHLIDRYLVAAHAGDMTPIICMNKVDLDHDHGAVAILDRYVRLGYVTLATSAVTGEGIDALRDVLKGRASVIVGQSGVGKSTMLNVVQPGLRLRTGDIMEHVNKGKHITTTATLIRLEMGGYVVDTPGIRSFDLSTIARSEYEMYFTELAEHVPHCKFPDCTHTHEDRCAIKRAVESGDIHPERYESYVRLFEESGEPI